QAVPEAEARDRIQRRVTHELPNVTVVDATNVARRLAGVLDVIAGVAQVLAALLFGSALVVLAATVVASRARRTRDLAVLRALGAGSRLLGRAVAWEFLLLGGIGAGVGAALAWGAARVWAGTVLDLPSRPSATSAVLAV